MVIATLAAIVLGSTSAFAIGDCDLYQCVPWPGCLVEKEVTNCVGGVAQVRCVWYACSNPDDNYTGGWQHCNCNGGGGGCFLSGTPVMMANGGSQPIQDIKEGDLVLSFDPTTNATKPSKVVNVHEPRTVDHYIVVNESIRMSGTQPILSNGQWIEVEGLSIGDFLTAKDGVAMRIFSIKRVDEAATVYNIEVADGTYLGNGIVAHNKKETILVYHPDDPQGQ
jgi:hypothetical protein